MASARWRGHIIIKVGCHWEYEDTRKRVDEDPMRTCGKCSMPQLPGCDDDPCLGHLPGVMNACCGHGRRAESFIQFDNGIIVKGFVVERGVD